MTRECEVTSACPVPATWRHRPTGRLMCDEHAARIDLSDLEDLREPDL